MVTIHLRLSTNEHRREDGYHTPVEPIRYGRLRLDFTERDFENNNNNNIIESTIPPLSTTTEDITPSTSQVIRTVISDIRRNVEEEASGQTSQEDQYGGGEDRPREGSIPTGEAQSREEGKQEREGEAIGGEIESSQLLDEVRSGVEDQPGILSLEGSGMEPRRVEPIREEIPWEGDATSGNGRFTGGGRTREPQREAQYSHPPRRENPNTHSHYRDRGRGWGVTYQPQTGRGGSSRGPDRPRNDVPYNQGTERDGRLGGPDRSRDDTSYNHGPGRGGRLGGPGRLRGNIPYGQDPGGGGGLGGPDRSRLDVPYNNGRALGRSCSGLGRSEDDCHMTERSTRGQTNRRNDLNPNAPPFHPRHIQQQRSQQSRTTLPTQSHSQSQSNKDKINTLFQAGLLRLTESSLLNDEEWRTFSNKLDELTRTIAQLCDKDRPQDRRDNNNRNGQRGYRQREASQPGRRPNRINGRERRIREMVDIQKLYRKNPKQAMQQIKQEPPPLRCQIPCQTVQNHFEELGRPTPDFDNPGPPPFGSWPTTTTGDVMDGELTQQEVRNVVKKMPYQSAPGPDRVTYANWREVDPTSTIITKILETCRRNKRVPSSWKRSNTILIHKGGDPADIKNWRPISLQNTIYKLYSAAIGKRLSSWAQLNNILSGSQKGFLPCEGCLEHNFLLTSVLQDSRRRRSPICITWLDLSNAFPSVPHGVLMEMLCQTGVGPHTRDIIRDIYTDSTMCVRTAEGMTAPIQCNKGVKQGCPLSPILFNLVMEPLIRAVDTIHSAGYTIGNHTIRSLAYADDLCILTQSTSEMQEALQATQRASNWAGLTFNPRKCGTLTLSRSARQFAETFSPTLNDEPIPAMKWEDHYKYLGCKVGGDYKAEATAQGKEYIKSCRAIFESGLTDWQKLDAVHRFAKPGLIYIMQNTLPNKSWAQQIDKEVRNMAKRAFKLPKRTISAFLHAPSNTGGLGIPCITDEIDVHLAATAFKLLATPDVTVKGVAYHHLGIVSEKRNRGSEVNITNMEIFLNSSPSPGEGKMGDIRSIWSIVRSSLVRCDAVINLTTSKISCNGRTISWTGKKNTGRALRANLLKQHVSNLHRASDQGRTSHCVALHPSSNHWIRSGKYISFGEYRFAIKARLNLLPTKTVLKRSGKPTTNTSCPGCNMEQETLAHILNHCPWNEGLIRHRHNAILHRLAKAIPRTRGIQYLEQMVPGDPQGLKPDVVVLNDTTREAFVIDVTVPFEGPNGTLEEAREGKVRKYSHLREVLAAKGYQNITVDAFVVGSLGSWDPRNDELLRQLWVPHKYAILFRKLCCWQVITGSYGIWRAKCNR